MDIPVLRDVMRLFKSLTTEITGEIPLICMAEFMFLQSQLSDSTEVTHVTPVSQTQCYVIVISLSTLHRTMQLNWL